jgi:uncharacterized protein YegL
MSLIEKVEMPRRTMVLFFIVDTSGSMEGSKIGGVNTAIREAIPEVKELSDENSDAIIKIAALEFSSGATWITKNGPEEVDQFKWSNVDAAGVTDFGAACLALNEKLSTKAFMKEASGSYAPAIFLLSDGGPTDDWKTGLDKLKQNNWFKAGIKVALAIGDDADKDVLKEFTGNKETVLECHNAATLRKMIKFLAVKSSQVASKSTNNIDSGDQAKTDELVNNIKEFEEEIAAAPDTNTQEW